MAPKSDPTKAIKDAIAELQAGIQPVEDQIAEIHKQAESDVRALEAKIKGTRDDIQRWQDALDVAEGRTPTARRAAPRARRKSTRARRGSTPGVTATQAQLVTALKRAGEPLAAAQIRTALGISEDVPPNKVSQFLTEALESGKVIKQGERRGTRYSIA